jgi:hypothetical protein
MTSKRLIPDSVVARHRYGVSLRTLPRWDARPELGFPVPVYINGRKYRDEAALDRFDREQAIKSTRTAVSRKQTTVDAAE